MSTEALLFDLDDTLVRPPDDGDERLAAAFEDAGVEPFFTLADFARWMPKVDGESPLDLRIQCFRGIAEESGRSPEAAERVARAFEFPSPSEFTPVESAAEVVTTLGKRGYDLALLTNGREDKQRAKLRTLGLEGAFDATCFGCPDRGFKPDPAPFETVLDDLGVDPEAAVKIGDRHDVDVEPAADMGITTVWYPPGGVDRDAHLADVVVEDLETLLNEPWLE